MTTNATARVRAESRATTFALVFGIVFAVLYTVCDMAAMPLFTYHPGTGRIDPGFARARPDEGPAMYWYGWIASAAIGAALTAMLATLLPAAIRRRLPMALAWIVPLALLPVLVYSLRFYWRWE